MRVRLMDGTTIEGVIEIKKLEGVYYLFFAVNTRPAMQVPVGAIEDVR